VELTDGCYSEGDSQGLPGFIHPRVLGIPTQFSIKTLLSKTEGCYNGVDSQALPGQRVNF